MSQYQSFFISAGGNTSQCEELNHFLKSHVVIRTVENIISNGNNCGIQILVEYKDVVISNQQDKKNARIDYRASLANDALREIFDKLKAVRLKLAKEKLLKAAYLVCKDEHLVAMIQNPKITEEEIKNLPNSANIMLKNFAHSLYVEYQKILEENKTETQAEKSGENLNPSEKPNSITENTENEKDEIPF